MTDPVETPGELGEPDSSDESHKTDPPWIVGRHHRKVDAMERMRDTARYTDDIHFPGGAMLMVDNSWAIGMVGSNAMPGAPDFPLYSETSMDRWDTPPWLMGFLRHQRYGPYWERASLAPRYERLQTPTFVAGGYLDIYQNFVMRIMRHSPAISRGVLGP